MILTSTTNNLNDHHLLVIQERKTVHAIQKEFHQLFPFLKLEFFYPQNDQLEIRERYKTLREYRAIKDPRNIIITPSTSIANLQFAFTHIYGIPVRVLRKKDNQWINVTESLDWKLEEHNWVGQWSTRKVKEYKTITFPDSHSMSA